jgi:ABC-type branched-subunit amino acid transport system ATPase component
VDSLRCSGVWKTFGGVHAVADVTFTFPECGIVAIIGPNGAGKTTLVNTLTGFMRPDRGRVYIGNRDLTNLPPYRFVKHGIVRSFQELRLLSAVPAIENVILAFPHQRGEALLHAILRIGGGGQDATNAAEARAVLDVIGLRLYPDQSARELSYGQQKMLALARCLATDARILLLDEPVAGLDNATMLRVLQVFHQLKQQGRLVAFIEHDLSVVRGQADIVVAMDHGRIVAHGSPGEVLPSPTVANVFAG